jgi:protein O-mannosyl-transferase
MIRLLKLKYFWLVLILISLVWTFLLYFRVVGFEFVNWDDNAYVYQNKDITDLSIHSVWKFFSNSYLGMYQPLTMLSFALEYHFFGLNPSIFHATNMILHLLNVVLVFILIRKLTSDNLSAFIVSLFFGIHPLHVESVAWISERKDVLYTTFYLLGLISYIHYLQVKKSGFWFLSILLFILSLLSKSAAVTFSLVIVLFYFYHQKEKFKLKSTLLIVWPFLVLSVFFGILSFYSQNTFKTPDISQININLFNKVILAGFSYLTYIIYLVYPSLFSAVHPLPVQTGYFVPVICYVFFVITVIIFYLSYKYFRSGFKSQLFYDVLFGFLFFTFSIFLILYNPASHAVFADRYTYMPYIGLFFIISVITDYLISDSGKYSKLLRFFGVSIILILALMYSVNTYSFIGNWENSSTLWNKTIANEPSTIAYYNNAIVKKDQADLDGALKYYYKSISYNPNYYQAYINIAAIAIEREDYSSALICLNKVVNINPSFPITYYNRGLIFSKLNKIPESIIEFTSAINKDKNYGLAYYSRANAYASLNRFDKAYHDVQHCLQIEPKDYQALTIRGYILYKYNRLEEALTDLNKAIELKSDYLLAYNNRALVYRSLHNYSYALRDLNYVIKKDTGFVKAVFNRAKIYLDLKQNNKACADLRFAYSRGIKEAGALIKKNCE